MNPVTKIWFWLLILSIIGLIAAFIGFELLSPNGSGEIIVPMWIWVVFGISIVFLIISFVLYCIDMAAYYHQREIAEACGDLPPPQPKKPIVCPPKCVEKTIIECLQTSPSCPPKCVEKTVTECVERCAIPQPPCPIIKPPCDIIPQAQVIQIVSIEDQAFAAAGVN